MSEYKNPVCKGFFMLGTACGTCERCIENLEQIKSMTGLVDRNAYDSLKEECERWKLSAEKHAAYVNKLLDKIVALEKECGREPGDY